MRPEELKTLLESDDHAVLVDVREQGEYDGGHIEGAYWMPLGDILACRDRDEACRSGLDAAACDKGLKGVEDVSQFVLYCRSGARSGRAVAHLRKLGVDNVVNGGGVMFWPYPLTRS